MLVGSRFHVLFHSPPGVLFTFPSRYCFAIGHTANAKVRTRLKELAEEGHGHLPICIAKTQYSFSTDPALKGAPSGHSMDIREVRLSVGAGFVVVICGDVMTMPGLPKVPASQSIDVVDGQIVGLF